MLLKGVVGRSRGYKGAKPWCIGSHVDVRDNEAYYSRSSCLCMYVHVHSVSHVRGWTDSWIVLGPEPKV